MLWCSKLQSVVSLSSAEAEYVAACHASREAVWLRTVCEALSIELPQGGIPMHIDNQACISMAVGGSLSARTKHIDVAHHYIRQTILRGVVRVVYCATHMNWADAFTKPLPAPRLEACMKGIGVA